MNNTNTACRWYGIAILGATACALLASQAGLAATGGAPDPGGVFGLRHGIYVAEGNECAAPANAALREYDGKGISTAHTRACSAVVRARDHDIYKVEQSCIDAGAGPAPRFRERQQILVRDTTTFVQVIGQGRTTYHYCPVPALPADLRPSKRHPD